MVRGRRLFILIISGAMLSVMLSGCSLWRKSPVPQGGGVVASGPVTLRGVVRNADGQPLSGVGVSVQGTSIQTVTDVGGSFELVGAPSGPLALQFDKTQYLLAVKNIDASGSRNVLANVTLTAMDSSLHNGMLAANGYRDKCASCHRLHASGEVVNPALLTSDTVNGTCFGCHDGANRGPVKVQYDAGGHSPAQPANSSTVQVWPGMNPTGRGNCSNCHQPHGTQGTKAMLRAGDAENTNAVCQTCHTADGTGNTSRWPGWSAYARTTNLHFNPPVPGNSTLKTYPGKSYKPGDCLNCHTPHGAADGGSATPALTWDTNEKLCIKCHTGFASRLQAGTAAKHKCSLCHNPHVVETGNKWLIAPGTGKAQRTTDSVKETKRGQTLVSDSYCTSCHYSGNSFGAPLYQNSNFKDLRYAGTDRNSDLHNVHLVGIGYGSGSIDYHGDAYDPRSNRLRCVDCHDVHPTLGPARPAGMSAKQLRTDRISTITLTSGKYNGKAGCGTVSPCHYDSYNRTTAGRSCAWCHASSSGGNGAPGWDCTGGHGYSTHGTVYWP